MRVWIGVTPDLRTQRTDEPEADRRWERIIGASAAILCGRRVTVPDWFVSFVCRNVDAPRTPGCGMSPGVAMTTTVRSTDVVVSFEPLCTEPERTALSGFLACYSGLARAA